MYLKLVSNLKSSCLDHPRSGSEPSCLQSNSLQFDVPFHLCSCLEEAAYGTGRVLKTLRFKMDIVHILAILAVCGRGRRTLSVMSVWVVDTMGKVGTHMDFNSRFSYLRAAWPWASPLISLSLRFLTSKDWVLIIPSLWHSPSKRSHENACKVIRESVSLLINSTWQGHGTKSPSFPHLLTLLTITAIVAQ